MSGEVVRCDLCHRLVPKRLITLHHLKPKSLGGRAEHRVPMCRPCHKQVHATFGNRTLDRELGDLDRLRQHPLLTAFMKWIRKQSPNRNFKTMTAAVHPDSKSPARRRR